LTRSTGIVMSESAAKGRSTEILMSESTAKGRSTEILTSESTAKSRSTEILTSESTAKGRSTGILTSESTAEGRSIGPVVNMSAAEGRQRHTLRNDPRLETSAIWRRGYEPHRLVSVPGRDCRSSPPWAADREGHCRTPQGSSAPFVH